MAAARWARAALLLALCAFASSQITRTSYDPRKVDWSAVVSACKAVGRSERRMASFIIRSAYHDAMSIDPACLAATPRPRPITKCGGADGSLLLVVEEQRRGESMHRSFAKRAAAAIVPIAAKYKASVADTLAVCGMVMPSAVGSSNMLGLSTLRVGRIDSVTANPAGKLLPGEADLATMKQYWEDRGMNLDQGIALLGIHGLMEMKGCVTTTPAAPTLDSADKGDNADGGDNPHGAHRRLLHTASKGSIPSCNPMQGGDPLSSAIPGSCPSVKMFALDNQFYVDLFVPTVSVKPYFPEGTLEAVPEAQWLENRKDIACSYSSDAFRKTALIEADLERDGLISHWPDLGWVTHNNSGVTWSTNGCASLSRVPASIRPIVQSRGCPHLDYWPYTRLDGNIAWASQFPVSALDKQTQNATLSYAASNSRWAKDFAQAFSAMVSVSAQFSTKAFYPTFRECARPFVKAGTNTTTGCESCSLPADKLPERSKAAADKALRLGTYRVPQSCAQDCVCPGGYGPADAFFVQGMNCGVAIPDTPTC